MRGGPVTERERVLIRVGGGPRDDDLEVSALADQVRRQLLELDVDRVDLVRRDELPAGAKAGEAFEIGTMVVTFGPTVLAAVIDTLKGWLRSNRDRSVELKRGDKSIKLSHASPEDTKRLVDAFLSDG
jgi:hypothetical protein